MKIRVKGNSIRLRLTQKEVADLAAALPVVERTQLTTDSCLVFSLEQAPISEIRFSNGITTINLSASQIEHWTDSDEESIELLIDNGQEGLKILVEKDFACLKPRIDETDQFPNPLSASSKC